MLHCSWWFAMYFTNSLLFSYTALHRHGWIVIDLIIGRKKLLFHVACHACDGSDERIRSWLITGKYLLYLQITMYLQEGSPKLTLRGLAHVLKFTVFANSIGVPHFPLDNFTLSPNIRIGCIKFVTSKSSNTKGEAAKPIRWHMVPNQTNRIQNSRDESISPPQTSHASKDKASFLAFSDLWFAHFEGKTSVCNYNFM